MPQPPKPRDHAPINFWTPSIDATPITSIKHLHTILNTEYPGLQRNPHYPTWLHDAETHLKLIQYLKDQTHLQRGDRQRLGQELGITRQKFTAWAQEGRKPRLYYELERMLSKTQAQEKINQIHNENNGITSTQDVETRLETYYPTPELTTSKHHTKRLRQCSQYFQALELLKNGGAYLDVARPLKVHHSQIQRWIEGQRPDYIELTRRIPMKKLGENEQWLPLIMEGSFHPATFIRVPITVNEWSEIQEVIRQLKPLDNAQLNLWKQQFGDITQEDAFAYLLGIIVSDANKQKIGFSSTYIELRLSKKYEWSKQVGEATCYYFGLLGISAERGKDRDSSAGKNTCYSWVSRSSPFITWITKTCLGLEPEERTTYSPIKTQWMLRTPKPVRKKFLQGLNDGDGWASIKDQVLGNACQPNIDFYKKLLQTFDIDSRDDNMRVKISRQESIIRAAQIPFFLHASERQNAAEKLEEMMQVRRNENPEFIPQDVINAVFELYSKGHSTGAIAEIIFDNYRVSYDRRRILYILKKYG